MTRKLTLFAVCAFEVALILFVVGWTALASVLPDATPEEQYRFALGKILLQDIETGEKAFIEFLDVNKNHAREADAYYWLIRARLFLGQFAEADSSFSLLKEKYPADERIEWIPELFDEEQKKTKMNKTHTLITTEPDGTPTFLSPECELNHYKNCQTEEQKMWFDIQWSLTAKMCFDVLRNAKMLSAFDGGGGILIDEKGIWEISFTTNQKMFCYLYPEHLYKKVSR